jgi:ribosomal protein S27E
VFNRYLRWFEREPVGALMPVDENEGTNNLLFLGALNPPRRTLRVTCMKCRHSEIRQSYTHGDHGLRCSECGSVAEHSTPFQSVQLNREWLPTALTHQMAAVSDAPTVLIENRLWRLAYINTKAGRIPVYLVRCGWHIKYDQVSDVLRTENEAGNWCSPRPR